MKRGKRVYISVGIIDNIGLTLLILDKYRLSQTIVSLPRNRT